jgi:predicted DCC family thiol-disulfide oxidoreductase YuxK
MSTVVPVATVSPVATVVYDGDCAFCTRTLGWAQAHLPCQPRTVDLRTADLDALGVRRASAERAVQWVEPDGSVASGARAVGRWWWRSGGLWRIPGALCLVPPFSWAAALIYRGIAANRHRLPGGSAACLSGEGLG